MAKKPLEIIEKAVKGIKVPKSQQNRHNDYVMWKQEGPKFRDWGSNTACYGGSMQNETLTQHRFECRSFHKGQMLPQKFYLGTMSQLRKAGLVPKGMEFWIQSRHARFLVPPDLFDRHTVFTALSLYRHCDCQRLTMYTAWKLFEALKKDFDLPYLQCLHYALGQLSYTGHTFISMGGYEGANGPTNPAAGWAMAYFGTLSFEQRAQLQPENVTTRMFAMLAATINPVYQGTRTYGSPNPQVGQLANNGVGKAEWTTPSPIGILHPGLAPLYRDPVAYNSPQRFSALVHPFCQRLDQKKETKQGPSWVRRRLGA